MTTDYSPTPVTPPTHPQRLTRSRTDAWIGGVCGGIAQRYGWDPTLIRTLFVVSVLLPGPQVLLYLILWIVIPRESA